MENETEDKKLPQMDEAQVVAHLASLFEEADTSSKESRNRMRNELAMAQGMLGDQWDKNDRKHRGDDDMRAEAALPVFPQMIESVVGTYSANPFGIQLSPVNSAAKPKMSLVQTIVDGVSDRSDFFGQTRLVLRNQCSCGVGYYHVLTERRKGAKALDVKVEAILNPVSVYVDPYSVAMDGRDARYVIVASAISCEAAKDKLGDKWIAASTPGGGAMGALESIYERNKQVPVMTVYEVVNGECWLYKTIGNVLAEEPVNLHIPQVPIVAAKGVFAWDVARNRYDSVGICYRAIDAQKALNYASSLLMERLALSTKSEWTADAETIKDFEGDWENLSHMNPPVLKFDSMPNGEQRPAPQKHTTAVELGDVQGAINGYIGAIGSITGVGVDGNAQGNKQMTAEEVLTRQRASEAVLGSVFENLAAAVKGCGRVVLDFLRATYDGSPVADKSGQMMQAQGEIVPDEFEVIVDAGVLTASVRRENVLQLLSLIDKVPNAASTLLPSILRNIDADVDEETAQRVAQLASGISPEQAAALSKENEALKAQLAQLQQQLLDAMGERRAVEVKAQADLLKTEMNNKNDIEVEAIRQQGENERAIARIQADYEARIQKLEADMQIALAKLTNP